MISSARARDWDGTTARHWLDGHALFFETVRAIYAEMSLAIHRHRFRKDRRPVDTPISEDCSGVARDRKQTRRALNLREPDPLAELFLLLIIRGENWFARNTETIRKFRFALALVGIFPRHADSDSQLGANQRTTKVNLRRLDKVSAMNGPALAKVTTRQTNEHESSDGWALHRIERLCCGQPAFAGLWRGRHACLYSTVKPHIIFNPVAGSVGDIQLRLEQLRRLNAKEVRITQYAGEAQTLARAAIRAGSDYIIAVGGDGTLNEVINGIATSRRASQVYVGVVPVGTANDFARSIGLIGDIDANIDTLRTRKTMTIDLVRMISGRTRYFVNVSAGGFSGVVDEKLTPEIKAAWGPLAYLRSAAAALPEVQAYRTTMIFDDTEELVIDLYNVVVANGQFVGSGLPIAPQAKLSDGLLDVVLVPKRPATEMALLAAEMLLGKHISGNAVPFRRAKKIAVRSRPGMSFNADGELVGNQPAVFQIIPHALDFVVNK
jgi:diacylglycerol kinase (ATP)